jgi:S1-C subfamily serine protease
MLSITRNDWRIETKHGFAYFVFLPVLLVLSGCTTVTPTQNAQPNPVSSVRFSGTVEQAFELARNALLETGITPKAGSPELGYVTGEHGLSAFSWGEIVAIYFKEEKPNDILLWVVSKPKLGSIIFAPDWTEKLVATLQAQISQLDRDRAATGKSVNPSQPSKNSGTGFLISSNGIIVTAYHVVEGATDIQVRFPSGKWLSAKPIKHSRATDLAILKADIVTPHYLTLAVMNNVKQGQDVFTLGYPVADLLGEEVKYTAGNISSLSGLQGEDSLMQITVPVQPGNSGGPLVNKSGEVVGVITSSAAMAEFFRITGSLPQNVNWAVKASYISLLWGNHNNSVARRQSGDVVESVKRAVIFIETK